MSKKNIRGNRSERARETTKKRRPDGDRKRGESPMVAGDPRNSGRWISAETSLGPFPLPVEETVPAKKQKTAPQRVAAPTPKAVAKKPEARGNPTKPQPTKNQVCPKTWSPRSSPKQRRSWAFAKPPYLAPLKENRFYPLVYIKGEKPTLHQTTKTTQHEPACSYKPKIKSYITRPRQEPARSYSPATRPFISTGAKLAKFKASLQQAKDRVQIQILSMPVFKEDKLGCCT
ncbi:hypothetical protein MRB53_005519 [Persea americana]|uniref:Uncharacterized protein n=1 Tax=Persea americana TaxID=3435 RepID=A0ACC2MDQ9_PERAE|nr:hypothetical protein MRB53_005519 [Persea americana]